MNLKKFLEAEVKVEAEAEARVEVEAEAKVEAEAEVEAEVEVEAEAERMEGRRTQRGAKTRGKEETEIMTKILVSLPGMATMVQAILIEMKVQKVQI